MQSRFLVTCWPGAGIVPSYGNPTVEELERTYPPKSRVIKAKDAHQAAVSHLVGGGCTSDGCDSQELLGPFREDYVNG